MHTLAGANPIDHPRITEPWDPVCSPPSPLPSRLNITVIPQGPIIAALGTEVVLTCDLESDDGNSWLADVQFSWELDRSAVQRHQYRSPASNTSMLVFNMSMLTEGSYRCITSLSDADYPITEISTDVKVELPRKCYVTSC